jgi:hypothetical protein
VVYGRLRKSIKSAALLGPGLTLGQPAYCCPSTSHKPFPPITRGLLEASPRPARPLTRKRIDQKSTICLNTLQDLVDRFGFGPSHQLINGPPAHRNGDVVELVKLFWLCLGPQFNELLATVKNEAQQQRSDSKYRQCVAERRRYRVAGDKLGVTEASLLQLVSDTFGEFRRWDVHDGTMVGRALTDYL